MFNDTQMKQLETFYPEMLERPFFGSFWVEISDFLNLEGSSESIYPISKFMVKTRVMLTDISMGFVRGALQLMHVWYVLGCFLVTQIQKYFSQYLR